MNIDKESKSLYVVEIQTDVNLISFLTLISVFYIGALLPQFNSYDPSIKIPISFLIISTFGFLFSALILSNGTQKIIQEKFAEAEKYFLYGYALSEYVGVFLFVTSIPLTVNIITSGFYLRAVTFLAAILGMAFYQFMGFAMLENHFSKSHKLFSIIMLLLSVILFFSQIYKFYFTVFSLVFIIFILALTFLATVKEFQ